MNERGSFYRKITYLVLISVLLFPISYLGAPSTLKEEGGRLARLRAEYDLGQADLGEIDPASETIRLATLGLRGIAVSMLWTKANEYKKKEDWTNFRATLRQLAKLQPYFISFWRYQAWNLTYNVSVELDDVRDRFYYVERGIEFLQKGTLYNRDSPYLLAELGWFIGNKIGRADEHVEYRRMFRLDDDFHNAFTNGNPPPPEQRDNWLVSKKQYDRAISAVDDKKRSLGKKNPTTFYAAPGMAQINYGEAIEKEGTFGEKAKAAWAAAARLWRAYGNREMLSSRGFMIRLAAYPRMEEQLKQLQEELDAIGAGARESVLADRKAALSPEESAALETGGNHLVEKQQELYYKAVEKTFVSTQDIADRIAEDTPDLALTAYKLANQIADLKLRTSLTKINRDVSNYEYWETRCEIEQTPEVLRARELAYAGQRAFRDDADLFEARRLFEESFDLWAKVLKEYPSLPDDSTTGADIMEYLEQYAKVLQQLDLSLADEEIDKRFPLWDILEANDSDRRFDRVLLEHQRRLGTVAPEEP